MLERFLLREFGELFEKSKMIDTSVAHAQEALARRTFQLRILSRPMDLPESAAAQMLSPFRWQPRANWEGTEGRFEIDAFILRDACVSLAMDASLAVRIRRKSASRTDSSCGKIDIVNGEQRLCDENVSTAEIKVGN